MAGHAPLTRKHNEVCGGGSWISLLVPCMERAHDVCVQTGAEKSRPSRVQMVQLVHMEWRQGGSDCDMCDWCG